MTFGDPGQRKDREKGLGIDNPYCSNFVYNMG
jgi:hypothetical protein